MSAIGTGCVKTRIFCSFSGLPECTVSVSLKLILCAAVLTQAVQRLFSPILSVIELLSGGKATKAASRNTLSA